MKTSEQSRDNIVEILKGLGEVSGSSSIAWSNAFNNQLNQALSLEAGNISYHKKYLESLGNEVWDVSTIVKLENDSIALWPFLITLRDERISCRSDSEVLIMPATSNKVSQADQGRLAAAIKAIYAEASASGQTVRIALSPLPFERGRISDLERTLFNAASAIYLENRFVVDLTLPLEEIHARFRKSYKPLINKARRLWHAEIFSYENIDDAIWEEFRSFHRRVSGRTTRSQETWNAQRNMLSSGNGLFIRLTDNDSLIGGAFFQYTRDEALYAVGVYDRDYFDKPVSHLCQQLAIERLKAAGVRRYLIGKEVFGRPDGPQSEKERHINLFKSGFCTHYETAPVGCFSEAADG